MRQSVTSAEHHRLLKAAVHELVCTYADMRVSPGDGLAGCHGAHAYARTHAHAHAHAHAHTSKGYKSELALLEEILQKETPRFIAMLKAADPPVAVEVFSAHWPVK